ncbi:hypothetical protein BX616_002918, partial [Lobosporangium transversale]
MASSTHSTQHSPSTQATVATSQEPSPRSILLPPVEIEVSPAQSTISVRSTRHFRVHPPPIHVEQLRRQRSQSFGVTVDERLEGDEYNEMEAAMRAKDHHMKRTTSNI